MRILIVGGTSSLARALKPVLADFAEVITAGRSGCDVHLDLNNPVELMVLPEDIDVVINTAASFGGKSFEEMYDAERMNVLGGLKLCQASVNAKVKHLISISSIFALLEPSSPFYNIYALSKKHSDEIDRLYCANYKLALTVLRPSQFYGVGEQNRKHQPFLSTIIEKAANNEDIEFFGTNDAERNFIHLEDVAKVISLVVQHRIEGVYSCVNPQNVTYSEVAAAAIDAFKSRSTIKFLKEKPDIPDNSFELDDSLFRMIDFYPKISIEQGMKKEAEYRNRVQ